MTAQPQERVRFAFLASTAGSVMNETLKNASLREHVHSLVVDQECTAIDKARAHGIPVQRLLHREPGPFCAALLEYCKANAIDYILSFYTQFYSQAFRDAYRDRIINFHPSILPAFKGMDGFGDQVRYHTRFVGGTVEFIDQAMDEGKIIMQHLFPFDDGLPLADVRHRLFVQQCRCLLQVSRWLVEGRVRVEGRRVTIEGAGYGDAEFSPALDWEEAREHVVPRG